MKKIKKIVLAIAFTLSFFCFSSVYAQTDIQKYITIQVFESTGSNSEMIVVDNNSEVTIIKLEKINFSKYGETFGKNIVKINREINKWTENGYKILTYDKVPASTGNFAITNIILVKD